MINKNVLLFSILFLCALLIIPNVNAVLTEELVSYWSFDNDDITGSAIGDSLNLNNLTARNSPTTGVTGILGQAIKFNGVNQYLDALSSSSLNSISDEMSISFWMKRDSLGTVQTPVARQSASAIYFFNFEPTNVLRGVFTNNSNAEMSRYTSTTFEDKNNFVHIVITFDNSEILYYLNGSLASMDAAGGSITTIKDTGTAPFEVGRMVSDDRYINGTMDEVGLWNRTLTPTEVASLWNDGAGLNPFQTDANFTIKLYDLYLVTNILNFSAIINGTNYTSNILTGEITTPYPTNGTTTDTLNITLFADNYFDLDSPTTPLTSQLITFNMTYEYSRHLIQANEGYSPFTSIDTFNITASDGNFEETTDGSLIIPTTWNTTVTLTFNSPDYGIATHDVDGTENNAYNFTVYQTNSINIRIYDEETKLIIDYTPTYVQLISELYGANYTSDDGVFNITLVTPTDYIIRYGTADTLNNVSSPNATFERNYWTTLTSGSFLELDLYLLNRTYPNIVSANGVGISVYESVGNVLAGAIVNVNKYFPNTNQYVTVERLSTNFEGKAVSYLTSDEFYRFVIEYNNATILSTSSTKIFEETLTFIGNLYDAVTTPFTNWMGVEYTLSFNNNTNTFTLTYSDPLHITTQMCLYVYENNFNGATLIDSSCSSSQSGTLLGTITTPVDGREYIAKAYADIIGSSPHLLDSFSWLNPLTRVFDVGGNGVFYIILLTLVAIFMGAWSPVLSLILAPMPLLVGTYIGLISIPVAVALSVLTAFIIILVFVGRRT